MSSIEGPNIEGACHNHVFPHFVLYMGEDMSDMPRDAKRVRVHPSVKAIGAQAFQNFSELEEAELHDGLEQIGEGAFSGCRSLTRLEIPPSVRLIGTGAFLNCTLLEGVELRGGLKLIGRKAFKRCSSLRSIKIPSTVRTIPDLAFEDCHELVEVDLPEGLERIGLGAFRSCISLGHVRFPSTVEVIGEHAFCGCKKLAVAEVSEGAGRPVRVKESAFRSCASLKCAEVVSIAGAIEPWVFNECSLLEEARLHEGIELIERSSFRFCAHLKCVKIPSAVEAIDQWAFAHCKLLVSIELCDGIKSISNFAFQNCFSIRNIMIPSSARASCCFEGCYDLLQLFGSQEKINDALKTRFDGLLTHSLCYYHSHHPTGTSFAELKRFFSSKSDQVKASSKMFNEKDHGQDCLGMTPLHILACSTTQHFDLYQMVLRHQPESLVTEDKWGCPPILYAIWVGAPREIIQYMIAGQKSLFPNLVSNWNKMTETLCRAGASLETVQALLEIRQVSFLDHSIDWKKVARELAIRCVVRCNNFGHHSSVWRATMAAFSASRIHYELVQSLLEIEQSLFPNTADTDWRAVCEQFVRPLKGWWRQGSAYESLKSFRFLVKCGLPERLNAIGVRKWRADIESLVEGIPSFSVIEVPTHFDTINFILATYEREHRLLEDVALLLELALWKSEIAKSTWARCTGRGGPSGDAATPGTRAQCRISCGAAVIVPNVLPFLFGELI